MRKKFFILLFFISLTKIHAQISVAAADTEFFYTYGGTNPDEARSVKELPGGGYILAGTTSSFGQGNTSVYLVRTDSMGRYLWSAPYGGAQNDWGYSVQITQDSGYFVGGYSNSFDANHNYNPYYFKTDKHGNLQWQKIISTSGWCFIYATTPVYDGGYILCGKTYANSNGGSDAYLTRINKNGDTLWTKHYGGLFDEEFDNVSIVYNQIYVVGKNATHATDTVADAWFVKLDTNGNILKNVFFGGTHHYEEILQGITPYSTDSFHVCGRINLIDSNSTSAILFKADTALNLNMIPNYFSVHEGNSVAFNCVVNTDFGGICVIGSAIGGYGENNMFFIGYDHTGTFVPDYARNSGSDQNDYGYDGILTKSKRLVAVGSTANSQFFCPNTNLGSDDVFLVRFNTDMILNTPLSVKQPVCNCFTDTLFLWQAAVHYYASDVKLNLFPNPTTGVVQLEIICDAQKTFSARVFSMLGNEVQSFKVTSNNANTLDLSGLSDGSYFLKLQDESGQNLSVLKFIKSN